MNKKIVVSSAAAAMLLGVLAPQSIAANPYLPLWEHLPDGEPRVFEDPDNPGKYRVYIIGSHDVRYDNYCGVDIRAWSAPVENLNNWRDDGAIFTYQNPANEQWDIMFAPDLVEVLRRDENGERTIKEYYLYPHSRGPGREAMVAKGNRPDGPFEPINLGSDGRTLLPGSVMGFDPSVYIEYIDDPNDPDYDIGFRAYGYWGFQKSLAAEFDQNTMYSVRPGTQAIQFFIPASSSYGNVHDPEGTEYPYVFPGEDLGAFNFFEAASIRKVGNKYVWVYSGYSGPDYGVGSANATLRYAYGDTPLGPWRSGGVLIDARAPVPNENGTSLQTSYSGHNTHGSIEEINGQWYVFYHRAPRSFGYARQAMVAPIHITWDDKSVTEGGKVTIRGWAHGNKTTTTRAGKHEYTGAEVTSEGFNINGLDPYRYYSAGIACYLSNQNLQADAWDIWDDHAPLTGVSAGNTIGYKYFAFNNTGNSAEDIIFNLFLNPLTDSEFKIGIWLDGPWDNDVWNGKKIGEITVPAGATQELTRYTADVSDYVKNLNGKHAIYITAEMGTGKLFDLHGLGFSAAGKDITRPEPPKVSITADGVPLELPQTPVRATIENGITDYSRYEITYTPPEGSEHTPSISASVDNPDVKISITATQADNANITSVEFDYNGMVKTYRIILPVPPASDEPAAPTQQIDNEQADEPQPAQTATPEEEVPVGIEKNSNNWLLPALGGILGAAVLGFGVFCLVNFINKKK